MVIITHIRELLLTIALLIFASNVLQSQTKFDPDDLRRVTVCNPVVSYTFSCIPLWEYDRMNDTLIREDVIIDTLYPQMFIDMVNKSTDPNKTIYSYISSNDTVNINIVQFKYKKLYDRIEPLEYLITTTFTLTELPDIKFINFVFEGSLEIYNRVLNREKALGLIEEIKQLKKTP
jgi:hypothetical protein